MARSYRFEGSRTEVEKLRSYLGDRAPELASFPDADLRAALDEATAINRKRLKGGYRPLNLFDHSQQLLRRKAGE